MNSTELAWAAGFFDAEGSISQHTPKGRKTPRPTLDLSQAGGDRIPHVIERFREVVGAGSVFGPYRGYLYYWRTHDAGLITSTVTLLWPWLGNDKREQVLAVARSVPSLWSAELLGATWASHLERLNPPNPSEEERAWAAGFFDGDGSIGAYRQRTSRSEYLVLGTALVQASADQIPTNLPRFRDIVGVGSVGGPYPPRGAWSRLPQYRWQLKGRKVEQVVSMLWPWLDVQKRADASRAIEQAHATFAMRHELRRVDDP